jgi:LacI family transcriptional regulator
MRSTIRQVAARAKVSPMTVSHALNGRKQSMGAETYERVLEAVRELNYVPVRTAAQNRHVETRAIGVVPFHANLSHTPLDNFTNGGIYEGARKHGYDILVMLRDDSEWMVNRQGARFLDRRSDGFIFVSSGAGEWDGALAILAENNIPTVVCYRRDVPAEIAWVDPDNEAIVAQLMDCFQRHGHRRIAYLGNPSIVPLLAASDPNWLISTSGVHPNYDDVQRRAAFETAIASNPHWEHHIVFTGATSHWELSPDAVPTLLQEGITAVICTSDFIAMKLLDALSAAGVRVPEDISVAGVDDLPEAAARGLTSVAFGYSEVGRLAVEAWTELRQGKAPEQCSKVVSTTLIERSSVGAPNETR